MANRVTKDILFSESRNNVVDLINSNVSDPTIGSAEYRKWIYSREPDVKSVNFKGYPFLVISSSEVNIHPERASLDMKSKLVSWINVVEIITSDRGYGGKDGQGQSQNDTLGDSILSIFNNKTNRITLSNNSMKFSEPRSAGTVVEPIDDELTFRRTIILNFNSKIQISS